MLDMESQKEIMIANDESVLEGLNPHPNLKRLEICGFKGKSLPLWDGLSNVMEIRLTDCSECEELPMLGHLPHLKSLYLSGLTNAKSIRSSFYRNIDSCIRETIVVVFPELERLELCNMQNLEEWDEVMVFPRLKYLKIYRCTQLTRAPTHFPCLEELEIDGMESSLALESICGIKLTSLTRLIIKQIEGLECLPDWLFSNNHNLRKLDIWDCPKMTHLVPHVGGAGGPPSLLMELKIRNCRSLRELPDDLHSLNSLEKLNISDCPELRSIPYPRSKQQQGFTSLRELDIWGCDGMTSLPIEMIESCAPSLKGLLLRHLSSITNMGMVIGCLHKMTRLNYLSIVGVPKFSVKNTLHGSLSLQYLEMGHFSLDSSNAYFNETVDAMLRQCASLCSLELQGLQHWQCLPDQLQHLTSLEVLILCDFGIEALPEWFGNLSSLKQLHLWDCEKLRSVLQTTPLQMNFVIYVGN